MRPLSGSGGGFDGGSEVSGDGRGGLHRLGRVRRLIAQTEASVCVVDKLTYAGNLASLAPVSADPRYRFEKADIADGERMRAIFADFDPDIVLHLAAESHVDRSIDGPGAFIETNIVGTYVLLQEALRHWRGLEGARREGFRFHHISTDEVFGSLGPDGLFDEATAYAPTSPYSASKAASDHLVRAWHHTYGLPTLVTNCSNNYGPYHFPEKLIPLMIINGIEGKPCRSMATAAISATGSMSRTMPRRCCWWRSRAGRARPMRSGARPRCPTGRWSRRSARCSTNCGPIRPGRMPG